MNNELMVSLHRINPSLPLDCIDFNPLAKCGTYCIYDTASNKVYIGSSINCKSRIKDHIRSLKRGDHCTKKLQASFNGGDLKYFVIRYFDNYDSAKLLESYLTSSIGLGALLNHNIAHGGKSLPNASKEFLSLCEELLYPTTNLKNGVVGCYYDRISE